MNSIVFQSCVQQLQVPLCVHHLNQPISQIHISRCLKAVKSVPTKQLAKKAFGPKSNSNTLSQVVTSLPPKQLAKKAALSKSASYPILPYRPKKPPLPVTIPPVEVPKEPSTQRDSPNYDKAWFRRELAAANKRFFIIRWFLKARASINHYRTMVDIKGRTAVMQKQYISQALPHTSALYTECASIINKLAKKGFPKEPEKEFSVEVVKTDKGSAWAFDDGMIMITEDTMLHHFKKDKAKLAFVLAHEMSHVVLNHSEIQLSSWYGIIRWNLLAQLASSTSASYTVDDKGTVKVDSWLCRLMCIRYSRLKTEFFQFHRAFETEADQLAVIAMINAGYDPRGSIRYMEMCYRTEMLSEEPSEDPRFSTHPKFAKRLADTRRWIEKYQPAKETLKKR